eukprot:5242878-Amphidinium_carterae.2
MMFVAMSDAKKDQRIVIVKRRCSKIDAVVFCQLQEVRQQFLLWLSVDKVDQDVTELLLMVDVLSRRLLDRAFSGVPQHDVIVPLVLFLVVLHPAQSLSAREPLLTVMCPCSLCCALGASVTL